MSKPLVVVLCGSLRFSEQMANARRLLTLGGEIVIGPEFNVKDLKYVTDNERDNIKSRLDELHLRKIDIADRVEIICGGMMTNEKYIGDSTRHEIAYAISQNKTILYRECY